MFASLKIASRSLISKVAGELGVLLTFVADEKPGGSGMFDDFGLGLGLLFRSTSHCGGGDDVESIAREGIDFITVKS